LVKLERDFTLGCHRLRVILVDIDLVGADDTLDYTLDCVRPFGFVVGGSVAGASLSLWSAVDGAYRDAFFAYDLFVFIT